MILLDIPCKPISWKAPSFSKGHTYDKRSKEKIAIKTQILKQYAEEVITSPVQIDFIFYFTPPKRTPKKKLPHFLKNEVPCLTLSDCTNMQKLFEDCLQKIVIENDRQVIKISSQKLWSSKEHVVIKIQKISEPTS